MILIQVSLIHSCQHITITFTIIIISGIDKLLLLLLLLLLFLIIKYLL